MSIESIEHRLEVGLYAIHSGTNPSPDLRLLLDVVKAAAALAAACPPFLGEDRPLTEARRRFTEACIALEASD